MMAEPVTEEPTLDQSALEQSTLEQPTLEQPAELVAPSAVEEPVRLDVEPGTVATFERPARPTARPSAEPREETSTEQAPTPVAPVMETAPVVTPAPVVAPAPAPSALPTQPSRDAVEAAIASVSERMRECAPEYAHHVADVRFSFASSGRVTSALVPSDFAGPQQRSCVARAARAARVPPFSAERLDVTYPVQF
jgi:hypothetical protein